MTYIEIDEQMSEPMFHSLLKRIPESLRARVLRFKRWQDRDASLLGKLLLMNGLDKVAFDRLDIADLQYTAHGRPFLNANIDFNLSHTDSCVVCAVSENCHVGIDVEKTIPIRIEDFESQFDTEEWSSIQNAADRSLQFYHYWTRKEAVVKADGRGLSIPLSRINVTSNHVLVEGDTWFLTEIPIVEGHIAHLSTSRMTQGSDISLLRTTISTFLAAK